MRTSRLFWGVVLVILGGLLLLRSLGIILFNVGQIFWPTLLILGGVWLLFGSKIRNRDLAEENLAIPLESAREAVIDIHHGAGTLKLGNGASAGQLLEGNFLGGVEHRVDYSGQWASVYLSTPSNVIFGLPTSSQGLRWDIRLTHAIPLDIRLHTGAGENQADFSGLLVRKLLLETGASSSVITLPARADQTHVDVHAGAASVVLRVPKGVAGRIRLNSGLVKTQIDNVHFPFNGTNYETPGYEEAENRVEISVEAGVGSIEILSV